ncbi:pyridoxamine 5'-phosphate oxidase family protein [Nocardioides sambongensis]|uniref:pyridoxamine 5'-phosphate oxidase family protein n=1 Tax=Nocardioides sambongensis TaxID=2589074 RepID=UPI00112BDF73|nr:pyridoxamine 5'-phosphate oxidase family protein [Nocardioides sambongensis]
MTGTVELDRDECARRLGLRAHARVAVTTPSGPHQIPVTHLVDGTSLAFATTPYSVLGTYGRDAMVALEVDDVDETTRSGWSVVVRGRAHPVTDASAVARIRSLGLQPWAGGSRPSSCGSCSRSVS